MRFKKYTIVWSLALTVIGGTVGMLFAKHGILEPPVDLVVNVGKDVKSWLASTSLSGRSQFLLNLLFISVSFAVPRTIVGGIVLGLASTRIPYPKVLFYSVLAWPLVFVLVPFGYAMRFDSWAQQDNLASPLALTKMESSVIALFFYVAVSVLFALSYAVSFWISSKGARA